MFVSRLLVIVCVFLEYFCFIFVVYPKRKGPRLSTLHLDLNSFEPSAGNVTKPSAAISTSLKPVSNNFKTPSSLSFLIPFAPADPNRRKMAAKHRYITTYAKLMLKHCRLSLENDSRYRSKRGFSTHRSGTNDAAFGKMVSS